MTKQQQQQRTKQKVVQALAESLQKTLADQYEGWGGTGYKDMVVVKVEEQQGDLAFFFAEDLGEKPKRVLVLKPTQWFSHDWWQKHDPLADY